MYFSLNNNYHNNNSDYDNNIKSKNNIFIIGESLFTLFASLTYAYHYLLTLIK